MLQYLHWMEDLHTNLSNSKFQYFPIRFEPPKLVPKAIPFVEFSDLSGRNFHSAFFLSPTSHASRRTLTPFSWPSDQAYTSVSFAVGCILLPSRGYSNLSHTPTGATATQLPYRPLLAPEAFLGFVTFSPFINFGDPHIHYIMGTAAHTPFFYSCTPFFGQPYLFY